MWREEVSYILIKKWKWNSGTSTYNYREFKQRCIHIYFVRLKENTVSIHEKQEGRSSRELALGRYEEFTVAVLFLKQHSEVLYMEERTPGLTKDSGSDGGMDDMRTQDTQQEPQIWLIMLQKGLLIRININIVILMSGDIVECNKLSPPQMLHTRVGAA